MIYLFNFLLLFLFRASSQDQKKLIDETKLRKIECHIQQINNKCLRLPAERIPSFQRDKNE